MGVTDRSPALSWAPAMRVRGARDAGRAAAHFPDAWDVVNRNTCTELLQRKCDHGPDTCRLIVELLCLACGMDLPVL